MRAWVSGCTRSADELWARLVAPWSLGCSPPGTDAAGLGRRPLHKQRCVANGACRFDGPDPRGRTRTGPDPAAASRRFPLHCLRFLAMIVHLGLLIRGLGVQVPRGAPVIKALTWHFVPDRACFMSTLDGCVLVVCSGANVRFEARADSTAGSCWSVRYPPRGGGRCLTRSRLAWSQAPFSDEGFAVKFGAENLNARHGIQAGRAGFGGGVRRVPWCRGDPLQGQRWRSSERSAENLACAVRRLTCPSRPFHATCMRRASRFVNLSSRCWCCCRRPTCCWCRCRR